jgi:hypothetical protein
MATKTTKKKPLTLRQWRERNQRALRKLALRDGYLPWKALTEAQKKLAQGDNPAFAPAGGWERGLYKVIRSGTGQESVGFLGGYFVLSAAKTQFVQV